MPCRTPTRVLVVDDNHLIRRLLCLILEGAGFEAVEAESGEDALDLGREAPPAAWLVDEAMPGMTGSEVIRVVRGSRDRRLSRAAIVGVSGKAAASGELLLAGADSFVVKPIDERSVLRALIRAIEARSLEHEHLPAA
jgi:CheY-like chemotaxis protein